MVQITCLTVVYHLVPTSNHNLSSALSDALSLFIILFLHQTTTMKTSFDLSPRLFIILFLHQTTTLAHRTWRPHRCLSSCSYIKPQLCLVQKSHFLRCLSSCSYIKPQPHNSHSYGLDCCLSSCSYIKPQQLA